MRVYTCLNFMISVAYVKSMQVRITRYITAKNINYGRTI